MQENNFSHITEGILKVIETEENLLSSLPVIDSASNNHQRMIRLQYSKDLLFFPDYQQDNDLWIAMQD